jgi:MFS family permease
MPSALIAGSAENVDRELKMSGLMRIGIFAAGLIAGLVLGGFVPKTLIKESWRIPIAVLLVVAGIALAVMGLS